MISACPLNLDRTPFENNFGAWIVSLLQISLGSACGKSRDRRENVFWNLLRGQYPPAVQLQTFSQQAPNSDVIADILRNITHPLCKVQTPVRRRVAALQVTLTPRGQDP